MMVSRCPALPHFHERIHRGAVPVHLCNDVRDVLQHVVNLGAVVDEPIATMPT